MRGRGRRFVVAAAIVLAVAAVLAWAGTPATAGCGTGPVDAVERHDGSWYVGRTGGCGALFYPMTSGQPPSAEVSVDDVDSDVRTPRGRDAERTAGGWRVFGETGRVYAYADGETTVTIERQLPLDHLQTLASGARDPAGHWWVTTVDGDVRVFDSANETVRRVRGDWGVDRTRDGVALVGDRPRGDVLRLYSVPGDRNGTASVEVTRVELDPVVDRPSAIEPRPGGGHVVVSEVGNAFFYDANWRLVEVRHEPGAVTGGLFWLSPALLVGVGGVAWSRRRGEAAPWIPVAAFVAFACLAVVVREGTTLLVGFYWLPDALAAGALVAAVAALVDGVEEATLAPGLWLRYAAIGTPVLVVAFDYLAAAV